jgi:copper transport protein
LTRPTARRARRGPASARHRGAALRVSVAVAVAVVVTVGAATAASAHAVLIGSSPTSGQHLAHPPSAVILHFDQRVVANRGGISVLDSNGKVVSRGGAVQPDPDTLSVHLRPGLPDGAYVADYTVTSTDGHIVNGGVVFLVGNASPGRIGSLTRGTSSGADTLDKIGQFLTYLGVLAACGLTIFLAFVMVGPTPDGERRRLTRLTVVAAATGVVGMIVTIEAQTALGDAGRISFGSPTAWRDALSGGLGQQCALQLAGLVGCLVAVRARQRTTAQAVALYSTLVAAGAFVLFGHARSSSPAWVTIPADVVHVVCAAVWLGGLIGLVVVLRSRTALARGRGEWAPDRGPGGDPATPPPPDAGHPTGSGPVAVLARPATTTAVPVDRSVLDTTAVVVRRVSTVAAASVIALMVAGTALGICLVGSVSALFETTYGQLLLAKLAVFGLLLVMAAYNRYALLPALDRRSGWPVLARTARFEAAGVVAVLAVTAMLANTPPPADAARVAVPVPFSQTASFGTGHLRLRITPNQALVNDLEVQITDADGQAVDRAQSVAAFFTLTSPSVGPLSADLRRVGVGRYVLADTPLPPIVGEWQITLQIRVDDFNETDVNFTDHVR